MIMVVIVVVRHATQASGFGPTTVDKFPPAFAGPLRFCAKLGQCRRKPLRVPGMSATETCRCCSSLARLAPSDDGICRACSALHGPRVARLLARCRADAEFASTCLARLPEPARSRFAARLSAQCLTPVTGPGLCSTRHRVVNRKLATA